MSKIPDFAQGMDMPAMKKKSGGPIDLMRPGNGTPWEDRSSGVVGAYFKTVIKSLTSPALLMDHIRRPETSTDSNSFALISSVMWILGVIIYNVFWLYYVLPGGSTKYETEVDPMNYWMTTLIQCVLVGGGLFLFLRFGPRLYRSLGANELKNAQPSLISNCFNYAMGPSILGLIPYFGWALAILWILIDLMVAGKRRLYMKTSGAVINVFIIAFVGVLVAAVVYFVLLHLIWGGLVDMNGLTVKPPPPPPKVLSSPS
jgi:hypothetical protein